jgi:hypothetical protein
MQFEDGFTFLGAPTLHGIFFIFEAIQYTPFGAIKFDILQ